MNKRDFLKTSLLATAGVIGAASCKIAPVGKKTELKIKNWIWENPDQKEDDQSLKKKYSLYYKYNIRGIFFEHDSERHFKIAKQAGLETHRWMWTMNRGDKDLLENHKDMYAVSRDGKSCATNPPYVDYYRWLCPSKPETLLFLENKAKEIISKDYVDGLHLDYVRYCDVILPSNLWGNYNITQHEEKAEYDFCYCDSCRSKYKSIYGKDPLDIKYVDQSPSWRKFRYDQVNNIVNHLAGIVHQHNKKITAAVFPTPEVARRIVRQDWTNWNLDGICPMIYNGFYSEPVQWVGDAVDEGIHFLNGRFPLYAGLFLGDLKSKDEFEKAVQFALINGASGVSLFGQPNEDQLKLLKKNTSV